MNVSFAITFDSPQSSEGKKNEDPVNDLKMYHVLRASYVYLNFTSCS